MKSIGNIHVCWRKSKGNIRIPIGIIKNSFTNGISFTYLEKGVKQASEFGFKYYEGFPDIKKVYTENVIEIFGQRIIKSERSDVQSFYNFWGIDTRYKDNDLYMLAFTQGILPTDNFEFLADFNPSKTLTFISEITGLTESQLPTDIIKVGDALRYELEPENKFDNKAVKVFKGDTYLGHVKLIHSRVFYKVKRSIPIRVHNIEKNGVLKRVFIKIG